MTQQEKDEYRKAAEVFLGRRKREPNEVSEHLRKQERFAYLRAVVSRSYPAFSRKDYEEYLSLSKHFAARRTA